MAKVILSYSYYSNYYIINPPYDSSSDDIYGEEDETDPGHSGEDLLNRVLLLLLQVSLNRRIALHYKLREIDNPSRQ